MSNEEIKEKLPNELVVFMEFMDSILQFYEFKIGKYKVIKNKENYILEVVSWVYNANFLKVVNLL